MNILSLQTWSHDRGIDQVFEVAQTMRNSIFFVAGWPDERNVLANTVLLGYVRPIDILPKANVLLRLTRRNDPWGRDVLEALTLGVPVVATGTWPGYVEDGVNGYLIGNYTLEKTIDAIHKAVKLTPVYDTRFTGKNAERVMRIYESIISK